MVRTALQREEMRRCEGQIHPTEEEAEDMKRGSGNLICYLLEDEERREGSGNVQFDEVQTGLSVSQRRPLYQKTHKEKRIQHVI